MRIQGEITKTFLLRGFAFISGDDGNDYFLHADEWIGSWDGKEVFAGRRVSFEPKKLDSGLRALEVAVA